MKTRFGKITVSIILLLATAAILVGYMATKAMAATNPARKLIFYGSYTNPYVVFIDGDPTSSTLGMVCDKTTGIAETSEAWATNAFTVGAGITVDDITGFCVSDTPTLPGDKWFIICIGDNASPVKTDSLTNYYYNSHTQRVYDSSAPITDPSKILIP